MKRNYRVGRWLIGVAGAHMALTLLLFGDGILSVFEHGPIGAAMTEVEMAVCAILFGIVLSICGVVASKRECLSPDPLPKSFGWNLLVLALLGIVVMPMSGFWLVLLAAIEVLEGESATQRTTVES